MTEVLEAAWVLPIEPWSTIKDGAVAIDEGRIVAVGPAPALRTQFPDAPRTRLPGHVLMPGLVNAHTHAAMTLLRGFADDAPLMSWLQDRIWPAERRWVDRAFVRDGTRLAAAEMLRGGVTCFNDMYFFPAEAIEASRNTGIRIVAGQLIVDARTAYADGVDDHIAKALDVMDSHHGLPQVHFMLAPHAPYTVSDSAFERIAELSEARGLGVHIHVHETAAEVEQGVADHGVRPIERLDRLGILNERTLAVHAVHMTDAEIALFAQRGVKVAHCPTSNLKLASGFGRFGTWLRSGLTVGLGTDGAASNNRLDVLGEMRLASLLDKGLTGDAAGTPADQMVHTATLGGARALGLDAQIGSLEAGKSADLIAVDLSGVDYAPLYDVASHLVYVADRSAVTDVWVAGRRTVEDRELLTDDVTELTDLARTWRERMAGR